MRKRSILSLAVGAGALALFLAIPNTAAFAKSFWIVHVDVDVVVNHDGSLRVLEEITFDFNGSFSGAYRDINVREGESVTDIGVSDSSGAYSPGGCTDLGCSSPAGTFGVEYHPTFVRIVWHHSTQDSLRTFVLSYTMAGVATAYDDVVDVNLQVWGDQWAVGVDRLEARIHLPGNPSAGDVYVWGHPDGLGGSTTLGEDGVSPAASVERVPPEQWVELRAVFPTDLLTSTAGARRVPGNGLLSIQQEEIRFAEDVDIARQTTRLGLLLGAGAVLFMALGLGTMTYLRYGREPKVDYDRQYEQEPPTELHPAEVGALLSQGKVTEKEFTATLFDLIRQGAIHAQPTTVVRSTWGGLRNETISDLELSLGSETTGFRDFEQSVLTVVKRVLADGAVPLTEFRDRIREDAAANAKTYRVYEDLVLDAVDRAALMDKSGNAASVLTVLVAGLTAAAGWLVLPGVLENRSGGAMMAFLIVLGMVIGTLLLAAFLLFRRVRVKRTKIGALEAAQWEAFRRYLEDFSRIADAPSISLDLWDRYLVYAITLGVAEEVLEQARLHAPPELADTSSIFWYGTHGYTGGHTQNAFSGIESALSGAFTPPSSSGGGGGFSGGGGGGGGAW